MCDLPVPKAARIWRVASLISASAIVATLFGVASAQAQVAPTMAFDAAIGLGSTRSSAPASEDSKGFVLGLTGTKRIRSFGTGNLMFGIDASVNGGGPRRVFLIRPLPAPDVPSSYPTIATLSTLAGWQSRSGGLRLLAGPSLAYADKAKVDLNAEAALGLHARVDFAARISERVMLTYNLRATSIPSLQGRTYTLFGMGVGVRVLQPLVGY